MQIIESISEWQQIRKQPSFSNKKIGFVPTMGNLHLGHQSLLEKSVSENDITILSIFVNPTQFNDQQDFLKYPKTLITDLQLAKNCKVNYVLVPGYEELYPDAYTYQITENQLSKTLCGKHRPGHFDGVLTIVLKLLNLVQPAKAYFGEKDFQQLKLVKNMVQAFFLNMEIIGCPTVRDANGLALSSRNNRLTAEQYQLALNFPRLLRSTLTPHEIIRELESLGFNIDYIEEDGERRYGAVKIGDVRLIDNVLTHPLPVLPPQAGEGTF